MKKAFLLPIALVFSFIASAQIQIGIKAGSTISKVAGKSFRDEFQYGYHAGGFAQIKLGKRLAIQPEVLFNQQETRVDSNFSNVYQNAVDIDSYRNVKLNYLSIPILLNYKVANILTLQAGPQFSVLMNRDKNLLQNGQSAFQDGEFALLGGAQINLGKLRVTGRYFAGLNNLNDIDNQNEWKSEGFQVSLGFAF